MRNLLSNNRTKNSLLAGLAAAAVSAPLVISAPAAMANEGSSAPSESEASIAIKPVQKEADTVAPANISATNGPQTLLGVSQSPAGVYNRFVTDVNVDSNTFSDDVVTFNNSNLTSSWAGGPLGNVVVSSTLWVTGVDLSISASSGGYGFTSSPSRQELQYNNFHAANAVRTTQAYLGGAQFRGNISTVGQNMTSQWNVNGVTYSWTTNS